MSVACRASSASGVLTKWVLRSQRTTLNSRPPRIRAGERIRLDASGWTTINVPRIPLDIHRMCGCPRPHARTASHWTSIECVGGGTLDTHHHSQLRTPIEWGHPPPTGWVHPAGHPSTCCASHQDHPGHPSRPSGCIRLDTHQRCCASHWTSIECVGVHDRARPHARTGHLSNRWVSTTSRLAFATARLGDRTIRATRRAAHCGRAIGRRRAIGHPPNLNRGSYFSAGTSPARLFRSARERASCA